jgi:hypothetical protein
MLTMSDAEKYDLGHHVWDINPKDFIVKGQMQKNVRCNPKKGAYGRQDSRS